jgi:uncharacterized protein
LRGAVVNARHIEKISGELNIEHQKVKATAKLLGEGATIPFIARYRKEATGSLDEVVITVIRDRIEQLAELDKRRESILKSLEDQGKLTDELRGKVESAETMTILEDIYLPYRPKRRTRAIVAKEKGLEPLAESIMRQSEKDDPLELAAPFVDEEKGVAGPEEALSGARDIIAELINEDQDVRAEMRNYLARKGEFVSSVIKGKEEEGVKYKDYFDWKERVQKAPSHRVLAMRRGEQEGFLRLKIEPPDEEEAIGILIKKFVKGTGKTSEQVEMAARDCYKRLLSHSMETDLRVETKKRADKDAINVFGKNVRELLMAPPLGRRNVLAIDPGFRTGCKVVCLDRQGKLLKKDTVFPLLSEKAKAEAGQKIEDLCRACEIEAIAIGNGTGGRETEKFVRGLTLEGSPQVVMVNESGASVYSASETAREEFPDEDVTVRGGVSIGRRLMDPLAELVKIDPKSIGVGQYQHDVDQKALKMALDDVVVSCVSFVGVEVNTASKELLTYVSGLGTQLADNIVTYRNENGPFRSRKDLSKVPRLGAKAFEQAAGFLRIRDSRNPLDGSAVHPETYHIVEQMAQDLDCSVSDLIKEKELRDKIVKENYVTEEVGIPTLDDIMSELIKPGRDPRDKFESFSFKEGVEKMEDLEPGMKLPGIVTNITAFGAFVDVGVHQDGLVHISNLADRFVKDPKEIVKMHQKVSVTVLEVDPERKRISLSMKDGGSPGSSDAKPRKNNQRPPRHKGKRPSKKKPPEKFFNNPFSEALRKQ